jgi:hypothetical protein
VSDTSCDEDQVHNLLFKVKALGRYIGPHLSKHAQTTQEKIDVHTYPSGTTVVKAFIANDFIFYSRKQHIIKDLSDAFLTKGALVKKTWRSQKNCQKNQAITLAANMTNPTIYLICSMM